MKIKKISLREWRRRRLRIYRLGFVLISFFLISTPTTISYMLNPSDLTMSHHVEFNSVKVEIDLDKEGNASYVKTIEADFNKPDYYISNDYFKSAISQSSRHFSSHHKLLVNGEEMGLEEDGSLRISEKKLEGKTTLVHTYQVRNSVVVDKNIGPVFRARLLDMRQTVKVHHFEEYVSTPGLVQDKAWCWTTNDTWPRNKADLCAFDSVTSSKVSIVQDNPDYYSPVRIALGVSPEIDWPENKLPWSENSDNFLGKSIYPSIISFLAALCVALVMKFVWRMSPTYGWGVLGFSTYVYMTFALVYGMTPTIILLPLFVMYYSSLPYLVLATEESLILSEEEVQKLIEESEKD